MENGNVTLFEENKSGANNVLMKHYISSRNSICKVFSDENVYGCSCSYILK